MNFLRKTLPVCILALFLVIGIALLTPKAQASIYYQPYENLYYSVYDGEAIIESCSGYDSNGFLTIPETIEGYPVTAIQTQAFYMHDDLTKVILPNTVVSIGDGAFQGCANLTIADLGGNVQTLGENAFFGCSNLNYVNLGSQLTSIGSYAFYNCTALQQLTLPDSLISIGDTAFGWCTSLSRLDLGPNVESIGADIFTRCDNLSGVFVDENNPSFSSDASGVLYDKGKTVIVYFPVAFWGGYTVPDTVSRIPSNTFSSCPNLTDLTFGDQPCVLEDFVASQCNALSYVYLGSGVSQIGAYAFYNCPDLKAITVSEDNTAYSSDEAGILYNKDKSAYIRIPTSIEGSYTVPESITEIPEYTFSGCSRLTELHLHDGVTSIGSDAFSGCSGLTAITLPKTLEYMGDSLFNSCTGLTQITLPGNITVIPEKTFYHCLNLNNVIIPDGVTVIENEAFSFCAGLTDITLPASLATVGSSAFRYSSVTNVFYGGSEEQWQSIRIFDKNESLQYANITYNYTGAAVGDLTGDGNVNNDDVALLLWHTLFPEEYPLEAGADLTGDGNVNNDDVALLLWHTLFPEEYPL